MAELKTIYHVEGKLCKDFIGQISYTVCLDQKYDELDIEFSFAPQHFRSEDVTPELKQYLLDYCKKEYGIEDGLIAELGCGTGSMTELLAAEGYDMIGIDNSPDMLEVAQEKRVESGLDILYLMQDMREFELYGRVRAVISICDCMNYILEEEDLLEVFRLVNNYLDPGGIFVFDMNTPYKYREVIGNTTIAENREEGSFIWENCFDEESQVNEYALTLFIKEEDDLYRKHEEFHYQKAYEPERVKELLEEAGLKVEAIYDAFTREPVREDSERIYFIARECTK